MLRGAAVVKKPKTVEMSGGPKQRVKKTTHSNRSYYDDPRF